MLGLREYANTRGLGFLPSFWPHVCTGLGSLSLPFSLHPNHQVHSAHHSRKALLMLFPPVTAVSLTRSPGRLILSPYTFGPQKVPGENPQLFSLLTQWWCGGEGIMSFILSRSSLWSCDLPSYFSSYPLSTALPMKVCPAFDCLSLPLCMVSQGTSLP